MLLAFGILIGSSNNSKIRTLEVPTEALSDSTKMRIFVVRPAFWDDGGAIQYLRTAPSANDLDNKTNISHYTISGYTADTFYDESTSGDNTFNEYAAAGIVYYDIPISSIENNYFDLIRENPNDPNDIWNDTGNHAYFSGINHRILRIWGNGGGLVTNIAGVEAESRNVANATLPVILSGYFTCSNSSINGYGAYADLRDNFNLEGRGSLAGISMTDFTYSGDPITYDYSVSANRSVSTPIQNKIDRLKSNSGN